VLMLNCTFIGVRTKAYEQLVHKIKEICKKHSIKSKLKHINEIDDILQSKVMAIPSIHIAPGNILLFNPSFDEIEDAILENLIREKFIKKKEIRYEKNISTNRLQRSIEHRV